MKDFLETMIKKEKEISSLEVPQISEVSHAILLPCAKL
jgi:hypothetical protein